MSLVKFEVKLPEMSLQGSKKQLKKAEKILDSIRHIKQAPKSIHEIRKWQRQKDKEIKSLVTIVEAQFRAIDNITEKIENLKERDVMLVEATSRVMGKMMAELERRQESITLELLRSRSKYSEPLANCKPDLNNLIRAAALKK